MVRMLPGLFERIRRAAASERMTVADWLERMAARLPPE
jgi:hypothetical protein